MSPPSRYWRAPSVRQRTTKRSSSIWKASLNCAACCRTRSGISNNSKYARSRIRRGDSPSDPRHPARRLALTRIRRPPPTRRHRKRLCHIRGWIVHPLQRVSAASTCHHEAQVRIPLRNLNTRTDVSLRQRPGLCRATPLHIPRPSAYSRRSPFIFRPRTRFCPARSSSSRQALRLIVVRPLDQRRHRSRRLI